MNVPLHRLIEIVCDALKIQTRIKFVIRQFKSKKALKEWDNIAAAHEYWLTDSGDKITEHEITIIWPVTDRTIETLIIHEIIHAWQVENDHPHGHDNGFIRIARALERATGISRIYDPEFDD